MGNSVFLSPKDTEAFGHALTMIHESLDHLNEIFKNKRPDVLKNQGIKQTLSELSELIVREYQLSTDFIFEGEEKRIDPKYELAVYDITLELVSNVVKHAKATSLKIEIVQSENRLVLTIKDNGEGFDTSQSEIGKGNGLTQIRTHLKTFQGWMAVSSEPGNGTEVIVELNW